jgi:lysophospholipase L1-like esterase
MQRRPIRSPFAVALAAVAGGVLLLNAGCAVSRLGIAKDLAERSVPFQHQPAEPTYRLLVIGDSTAVGTGASAPEASVAGLIARDHPTWAIVNRASDGARFADLSVQLRSGETWDAVLILAGGNDVIRLTRKHELGAAVRDIAMRSRAVAPHVVLMPPGNVGNAPFFFAPLSWWMAKRSQTLHAIVREAAHATGAHYVSLYREREDDPFAQQPKRMNAADGLHPSDEGYVLWYRTLMHQAPLQGRLGGFADSKLKPG